MKTLQITKIQYKSQKLDLDRWAPKTLVQRGVESQISGQRHLGIHSAFQKMTWRNNALLFCQLCLGHDTMFGKCIPVGIAVAFIVTDRP